MSKMAPPWLLLLGLATRAAVLPPLGMIAVIQIFVYPDAWSDHLLWASILVFLMTRGPGALSVDYFAGRLLHRSERAPQRSPAATASGSRG